MEKITVFKTDDAEIEDLLDKHYEIRHHEIVPAEECNNGSSLDYDIDGNLTSYEEETFLEIKNGRFVHWSTQTLMNKLCADGHIEPGNYIIDISW
jgi:hypothetical protein